MQETKQENVFNLTDLVGFISRHRLALLVIGVVSFLFSLLVCVSIPPKFKSSVILFPTSSGSISQALVTESQQKKEILNFGEEEEVEQLMQVLLSSEIRNRIIEKYDLFRHYRIDPGAKYAYTNLYRKYDSNIDISRTEYMSIRIDVLDESADTAALIANDIAALVDSIYANIQRERATKAFIIVEKEFVVQKEKIKAIEDSLSALSKLGVIDVKSQTEMYSEQHAIAIATGNERAKFELEKKLEILAIYGSSHSILKEQMFEEVKQLAVIEAKYREAKIDLEQDLPNTYIVSPGEVADRKHYPIYWLTISVSVLSTMLFSIILLIFFDKYIKKKNLSGLKTELEKIKTEFELPKYDVMESYFKTKVIFALIMKWKWHLLVLVVVAGALGALFSSSWFIIPKYKSSAVVYPANITPLSDESESEQMLELIQSDDIKFMVIEAFDLYEHYSIGKDDANHVWKILKAFNGNVNIQKTPNEAIVISVTDKDPQVASDIADSIIAFYDKLVLKLNIEKSQEIVSIYKKQYELKTREIDSLGKILKTYRTEYGMLDMTAQVEKYTEAIYSGRSLEEARTVLGNWQEYGAEYSKNDSLFYYALSDMHIAKTVYDNAIRDASKVQTYSHVISKPFPADKKSYPIRWVIVLFSVLGAFFAGTVIISLIEGAKKSK
jgi:uncharacterized protein involved in exopolysaccharide biosynthesis